MDAEQLKFKKQYCQQMILKTSLTNMATPVISIAVGIKDFAYSNFFGKEKLGSPWGISPT